MPAISRACVSLSQLRAQPSPVRAEQICLRARSVLARMCLICAPAIALVRLRARWPMAEYKRLARLVARAFYGDVVPPSTSEKPSKARSGAAATAAALTGLLSPHNYASP